MTERLYYTDSYTNVFAARIADRLTVEGRPALILDRSYFYPTSGGQPSDRGKINGTDVVDVIARESDGEVLHVMADEVAGDDVQGEIDWARRYDHMQQHTGEHILTRSCINVTGAEMAGFHLGEEYATIDIRRVGIPAELIEAIEDLANSVVMRDLLVRAWFPEGAELEQLALRKTPDITGKLRAVQVGNFDVTACGGTHVAKTGEVGLIKITRTEKYKDMTRIEFKCGWRALRDYRRKNDIVSRLSSGFTVGSGELEQAVERLKDENRQLRTDLKAARQIVFDVEAAGLWALTVPDGGLRLVRLAWANRDLADLREIAGRLIKHPDTVVLLGLAGEKAQVILARSPNLSGIDMAAILHPTLDVLAQGGIGEAKGGGRPDFAQGGGVPADVERIEAALSEAEKHIRAGIR